jgi:hypothetical protein
LFRRIIQHEGVGEQFDNAFKFTEILKKYLTQSIMFLFQCSGSCDIGITSRCTDFSVHKILREWSDQKKKKGRDEWRMQHELKKRKVHA